MAAYRSALEVVSYVKSSALDIVPGTIPYKSLKSKKKAPGTKPNFFILYVQFFIFNLSKFFYSEIIN